MKDLSNILSTDPLREMNLHVPLAVRMATDFATLQAMVLGWSENEAICPTGIEIG